LLCLAVFVALFQPRPFSNFTCPLERWLSNVEEGVPRKKIPGNGRRFVHNYF